MASPLEQVMYGHRGRSMRQRFILLFAHLVVIVIVYWLLFGGGLTALARMTGMEWTPGDFARRSLLAACSTFYFLRLIATLFVFLERGMSWTEVATIAPWLLILHVAFALLGGSNSRSLGLGAVAGIALYLAGSFLNTGSEYLRYAWKRDPANRGRLYTGGLFRYAMHINYFGDVLLFTGFAAITGRLIASVFPALMLAGFIFTNIPVLDQRLKRKYGAAFDEYAAHTRKLIPWIY